MTQRPHLAALAERMGIEPAYTDLYGTRHVCSDDTRSALLAALGLPVSTEQQAADALYALNRTEELALLPPVRVIPAAEFPRTGIAVRVPLTLRPPFRWQIELLSESGKITRHDGRAAADDWPTLRIVCPDDLAIGYYTVKVALFGDGAEFAAHMRLILTPRTCTPVAQALDAKPRFGLCANLYTLRSETNWGIGDLTDFTSLVRWMGDEGGAFVGINPLHTLHNRDPDISPYSPVSRLLRNPIYLDVTAVPEWADFERASSPADRTSRAAAIHRLRATDEVDYAAVWKLKRDVLHELHALFIKRHATASTPRGSAFRSYVESQGPLLDNYATFMALVDHQSITDDGRDVSRWPPELQDPGSPQVAAFRTAHSREIDFHRYLQFEMDRQLAGVADVARRSGLPLGLYPDLAIGAAPHGAFVWARPDLFLSALRLGCPPDYYAPEGQEWGLPPINAHALRADGYEYWIRLLRANLAHGGSLRIDHVIGLKRQFWIPRGKKPADGAYVRQPVHDLLGILALESVRHGSVIVGEDLGTVPEGFAALLNRWGILSCQVLYFQRDASGAFLPTTAYSNRALVTSTTHDHVSLGGFVEGTDLKIRRRAGVIKSDEELAAQLAARQRDVALLEQRLSADGVLDRKIDSAYAPDWMLPQHRSHDAGPLCAAVYRFLCRTPAPLVGVMLDDIAGEKQPVNTPGVGPDRLRNWARKMSMPIETIPDLPAARAVMEALAERKVSVAAPETSAPAIPVST